MESESNRVFIVGGFIRDEKNINYCGSYIAPDPNIARKMAENDGMTVKRVELLVYAPKSYGLGRYSALHIVGCDVTGDQPFDTLAKLFSLFPEDPKLGN